MTTTQDLIARANVTIDAPPSEVWAALVSPAVIKQYMFGTDVRSDWKEGVRSRGRANGRAGGIRTMARSADQAGRLLRYTHFSPVAGLVDAPENYHTVTIALADVGGKTHVTLSQENNSTEEARKNSEKNWSAMLEGLKKFVEK